MATPQFASLHFLFEDDSLALARRRRQKALRANQEKIKPEIDYSRLTLAERLRNYKEPLSASQLANEVHVDRNTIYKWVRVGTLPYRKAGSLIWFDPAPTADWAERVQYLPIVDQH